MGSHSLTQELTVDPKQPTLANTLKSAGYATSVIGKWHLGFGKGRTDWNKPLKPGPLEVGFDYYFGMPTVNSGPPFVYVENHGVVDYEPEDPFVRGKQSVTQKWPRGGYGAIGGAKKAHLRYRDEYVGTTFAEKAVEWIATHQKKEKEKPFFLYLATTNIHHPFTPHPKFKGTSECGPYGDFVHELDWIVGEVLQILDELKIADNTLVIFTSDNGGMLSVTGQEAWKAGHRLNGKLLGFKFGAWEGGHRVPFLARWPAKIPNGKESDALISQIDLLPTFAALANASLPDDAVIDGVNQLPLLTGKSKKSQREMLVISPNSPKHLTIRKDDWVYIPAQDEGGFQGKNIGDHLLAGRRQKLTQLVNSGVTEAKIKEDAPPAQLYDLKTDPYQAPTSTTNGPRWSPSFLPFWRNGEGDSQLSTVGLDQPQARRTTLSTKAKGKSDPAPKIPVEQANEAFPWTSSQESSNRGKSSGENSETRSETGRIFHGKLVYNKQGEHYLTTLEPEPEAKKGSDSQTGVVISPFFIPEGGKMTFRWAEETDPPPSLPFAWRAERKWRLPGALIIKRCKKPLGYEKYAGRKAFIKIVDQSTSGWGHVTADHFQFDGKLLKHYFKNSVH